MILGSDDPALDLLALGLNQKAVDPFLYVLSVGSLEGLIYLREKYCQFVGCHLFDIESGTYNLPFVRLLFTDQAMVLVTLSHRQQGLLVKKGNPQKNHRYRRPCTSWANLYQPQTRQRNSFYGWINVCKK